MFVAAAGVAAMNAAQASALAITFIEVPLVQAGNSRELGAVVNKWLTILQAQRSCRHLGQCNRGWSGVRRLIWRQFTFSGCGCRACLRRRLKREPVTK